MRLSPSLVTAMIVLSALFPLHANAEEIAIKAVVRLPTAKAAIELSCEREEECKIQIGSFTLQLQLGRNSVGVRVSDENADLVFFDDTSRTSISYRTSPIYLLVYDPNSESFVINGHNSPSGSIELVVTNKQ